jgi:hypothetical protein
MAEPIGDESIYLWIAQFEKGLIQYTDTTNALRLFSKYRTDIRYNAPWKKMAGLERQVLVVFYAFILDGKAGTFTEKRN